jgi:hypothetical protein
MIENKLNMDLLIEINKYLENDFENLMNFEICPVSIQFFFSLS